MSIPSPSHRDAACCRPVQINSCEESIVRKQCRAFCGTVENSPVVQPRVNAVQKSSPASSRTAELPFPSQIRSSRPANDAGLEHKIRQPGVSLRAILNRAAKSAALLWDGMANLGKPAACCVSTIFLFALTCELLASQIAPKPIPSNTTDERIRFFQAQLARDPEYYVNYNRLAGAYALKARETGDISYYELAEKAIRKSLELESQHEEAVTAYGQLGAIQFAEHRFSEAAASAERALKLADDPAALALAGDAQLEMGDYAKAESLFARLTPPNDGRPHTGREYLRTTREGSLAWIRGDVKSSISLMKQACALAEEAHLPAENVAWTHFMLGEQLFQSGNLAGAEGEMNAALRAFPLYHRALAGMGQIRAAQLRFPDAADFYQRAIAVIPLPTYASALGDIYHRQRKDTEAKKQYALVEYIGQLGALNKQVYNRELALFFADHDRRLAEALALAQKELEVRHDVYMWDTLAWVLLKNNRAQDAHEAMQKALAIGTQDPRLFFHAAAIERKLGNSGAADFARKALSVNPEFHVLYGDEARRWLSSPMPNATSAVSKSN